MPPVSKPSPSLIGPSRIPYKVLTDWGTRAEGVPKSSFAIVISLPPPPLLVFTNTFQQRPILVSLPIADTRKTETPPFSKLPKNRTSRLQYNVRMTAIIFPNVRFFPREILFFFCYELSGKAVFLADDGMIASRAKENRSGTKRGEMGKWSVSCSRGKGEIIISFPHAGGKTGRRDKDVQLVKNNDH